MKKKPTINLTPIASNEKLVNGIQHLVSGLQEENESIELVNLRHDFIITAFEELVASETFAGMDSQRRKDLFNEYEALKTILDCVVKFVDDFGHVELVIKNVEATAYIWEFREKFPEDRPKEFIYNDNLGKEPQTESFPNLN